MNVILIFVEFRNGTTFACVEFRSKNTRAKIRIESLCINKNNFAQIYY